MKNPPKHLKKILWEYDVSELEVTSPVVLERVLAYGNMADIQYVGLSHLRQYFTEKKPLLDPKSHKFWALISGQETLLPPPSMYELLNTPTFHRSFR